MDKEQKRRKERDRDRKQEERAGWSEERKALEREKAIERWRKNADKRRPKEALEFKKKENERSRKWHANNRERENARQREYDLYHGHCGTLTWIRRKKIDPVLMKEVNSNNLPEEEEDNYQSNMRKMKKTAEIKKFKSSVYCVTVVPNHHPNPPHTRINTPAQVRNYFRDFPNAQHFLYIGSGSCWTIRIIFSDGRHYEVPRCNHSSLAQITTFYDHTAWLLRVIPIITANHRLPSLGSQAEARVMYALATSNQHNSNWRLLNKSMENKKFLSMSEDKKRSAHIHGSLGLPFLCLKNKCKKNHVPNGLGKNYHPPYQTTYHLKDLVIRKFETGICTKTNYKLVKDFLNLTGIRRVRYKEAVKPGEEDVKLFIPSITPNVDDYDYDKFDENYPQELNTGSDTGDEDEEPETPKSAFLLFCNDERPKIKGANPKLSIGEIAKVLGRLWGEVDPTLKNKYQEMADRDKVRYEKEMAAYKKGGIEFSSDEYFSSDEEEEKDSDEQMLDLNDKEEESEEEVVAPPAKKGRGSVSTTTTPKAKGTPAPKPTPRRSGRRQAAAGKKYVEPDTDDEYVPSEISEGEIQSHVVRRSSRKIENYSFK